MRLKAAVELEAEQEIIDFKWSNFYEAALKT